jgi:SAM-dependent methyltransferase
LKDGVMTVSFGSKIAASLSAAVVSGLPRNDPSAAAVDGRTTLRRMATSAAEQRIPAEWERVGQPEALEWWEARHRELDGFEAVGYAGAGEDYNAWLYRVRRRLFRRYVAPLARPEASVLDVGSGGGFYLGLWREAGAGTVTGSDVSPTAVSRLRKRFPGMRVERFDLSDPASEVPRERFGIVSAFDLLFHVIDDDAYARAMGNLGRLVEPGGYLVISENFRRRGPRRFAPVQVNREEGEVVAALGNAGFELLERHPMFVLMNAPACGGGPLLHAWWERAHRLMTTRPRAGRVLGPVLYPIEIASLRAVRRAPSTELAICRRLPTRR